VDKVASQRLFADRAIEPFFRFCLVPFLKTGFMNVLKTPLAYAW
jgi:hypothetical protein